MIKFNVERTMEDAVIPTRAYKTDAGFDLYSPICFDIFPNEYITVNLGIKIELCDGYEAQIRSRSGLAAKSGIFVLNSPGTIDQNYRGNIGVILMNSSDVRKSFKNGDRIAQMVIKRIPMVDIIEGKVSDNTDRGEGGFGSTG